MADHLFYQEGAETVTPPTQEKLYTADDVNHLVAREVAKQRMHDLERSLQNTNDQVIKMWAKFDAAFEALQRSMEGQDTKIRKEIERDFATKLDLEHLRGEVGKIWLKVSIPVGTVAFLASFAQRLWP